MQQYTKIGIKYSMHDLIYDVVNYCAYYA